ncbi:Wzz/FepE/Etk N-terminal domain-containing protein [Nocardia sp. NPDC057668]|uniref:Wzz/FepE/Etk N-terminal domain-containing protein n=1 Tax=Nocardia sp. NPDC057668 TaxID=3346202 RepID=UPI0036711523
MGLVDYVRVVRRRWGVVVVALLLGLLGSIGYLQTAPVTYTASSSVYVSMATGTSVNDSYQGGLAAQQRVRSYLELATSTKVLDRVIGQLGLRGSAEELRQRVTVASPPATAMLRVTVTAPSAAGARNLADEVVAQFRALVDELETIESTAAPAARVAVVDRAELPGAPSSPQSSRIVMIGILAGLLLGGGGALLLERLDRRVRSQPELAELVPVLGTVALDGPGTEADLRQVRARLVKDVAGSRVKTAMLTSFSKNSEPALAVGLARSLADAGRHVLLIDADTTRKGSTGLMPENNGAGLVDMLRGGRSAAEGVLSWSDRGIWVIPLGAADHGMSDLLASEQFDKLLAELENMFDDVLIDVAPVLAAADALTVGPRCGRTIGIAELGHTTSGEVNGAVAALATVGASRPQTIAIAARGGWAERLTGGLRR